MLLREYIRNIINNKCYFLAYGYYLNNLELKIIAPSAEKLGVGIIKDYKLIFNADTPDDELAWGNIIPSEGSFVYGILYILDCNEFENIDKNEPGYKRIKLPIIFGNKLVKAEVYIDNTITNTDFVPKWYKDTIKLLGKYNNFPNNYLKNL